MPVSKRRRLDLRDALSLLKEVAYVTAERISDGVDVVDAEIAFSTFNRANIGPMEASLMGEIFLAEIQRPTKFPDPIAEFEAPLQVPLGRPSHISTVFER